MVSVMGAVNFGPSCWSMNWALVQQVGQMARGVATENSKDSLANMLTRNHGNGYDIPSGYVKIAIDNYGDL